jgi:heme a synthase
VLVGLLVAYGEFHRGFRNAYDQLTVLAKADYGVDPTAPGFDTLLRDRKLLDRIAWPWPGILATGFAAVVALAIGLRAGLSRAPGGWLRCLAIVSLLAVMAQGLLGGFRVFLNALMGTNLAAFHGVFGQLAFCVFVAVAVLAERRRPGDDLTETESDALTRWTWMLVVVLVMQLIWAAMLRHTGGSLAQRLHILTAFVAVAMIVAIAVRILNHPGNRGALALTTWHLIGLVSVQLILGVEAYLGKFAALGPDAQTPPEFRPVSAGQAITRTIHQFVGCAVLASAVALALRAARKTIAPELQFEYREGAVPDMAAMALRMNDAASHEGAAPNVALMALIPPDDGSSEGIAPDVAAIMMAPPPGGLVR